MLIFGPIFNRRAPKRMLRLAGEFPKRFADRRKWARLKKAPPRRTRLEPVAGPVGLAYMEMVRGLPTL